MHARRLHFGWESFREAVWSVRDTTVVRLRVPPPDSARVRPSGGSRPVSIIARALGRTTVRVTNVHGASDTATIAEPLATELAREIVVARPAGAVRICPRPGTVAAGSGVVFRLRVLDRAGVAIPGAPVSLHVEGGSYPYFNGAAEQSGVFFDRAGPYTLVAAFHGRADTLRVTARPADAGAPPPTASPAPPCDAPAGPRPRR